MKKIFVVTFLLLVIVYHSFSQMVNGNGFIKQNRVEVGVANNGSYGTTENAPAGYHPRCWPLTPTMYNPVTGSFLSRLNALGFVADYDTNGWNGLWTPLPPTPPFIGDYFMPGTPQEGWAIEINGQRCNAYCANYTILGATGYTGGNITGVSQYVSNLGGLSRSFWEGNYGLLNIKQVTTLRKEVLYFTGEIKLHNTGSDTMKNIYYMRTLDPDNDVSYTLNFDTRNNIVHQIPNAGNKVLISCTSTVNAYAYLGLGTIDCRAKPFMRAVGLFPPSDSLAYLFSGTHPLLVYNDSITADIGVGIIYKVGNLAPGDSAELHYAYVLKEAMLDAALDEIKPQVSQNGNYYSANDTIFGCIGSVVPLHIVNGSQYNWTWASSGALSNTSGISTNVLLGSSPVIVSAFGTGICNDTLTFYVMPTNTIYSNVYGYLCNGSFSHHGVTYNVAGSFTDTLFGAGCDSIFTVHLSSGVSTYSTLNEQSCVTNPYFFNGNLISSSGTYQDTLVNFMGCDSFITLNLNIYPISFTQINDSSCNYILINGVTYNQSGIYVDTASDIHGCDSVTSLNLTITILNANIITAGSQLTTNIGSASYQWLSCSPYLPIAGATNQVHNVSSNGSYAVVVSLNGCQDTADCVQITSVDLEESSAHPTIFFYPNPVSDRLQIVKMEGFKRAKIQLLSLEGKILWQNLLFTGQETFVDMKHLAKGFYFIEIEEDNLFFRKKIFRYDD